MSFRSRTCFGKRKKRNCRSLQRDPTTNKQQWRRRRKPTRLLLNVCRPGQGQTANCKKDKEGDKRQKAALAAFWKISQPPLFSPKKTKKNVNVNIDRNWHQQKNFKKEESSSKNVKLPNKYLNFSFLQRMTAKRKRKIFDFQQFKLNFCSKSTLQKKKANA